MCTYLHSSRLEHGESFLHVIHFTLLNDDLGRADFSFVGSNCVNLCVNTLSLHHLLEEDADLVLVGSRLARNTVEHCALGNHLDIKILKDLFESAHILGDANAVHLVECSLDAGGSLLNLSGDLLSAVS